MKQTFIGIDLGGTKILSCVLQINKKVEILSKAKIKTQAWEGEEKVINRIEKTIKSALKKADIPIKKISAIGIGVPGAVDTKEGFISFASNLGWENVQLKKILESRFNVPVFVNNDANLGTLAEEKIGAGAGAKDVVGIYWGTGIGGGIVIDGKIVQGSSFTAGEIGHMLVENNGKKCTCGRHGCFESYAAKWALTENVYNRIQSGEESVIRFEGKNPREEILKSSAISEAFISNDKVLKEELLKAVDYFGMGVANLINILNPDVIVVGGGMIESMEGILLPLIKDATEKNVFQSARYQIKTAELGDFSVLAGAAYFAQQRLKSSA
jgi:glucokinase